MHHYMKGPWCVAPDPGQDCPECGECHQEKYIVGWEMDGGGIVGLALVLPDDHEKEIAQMMAAAPELLAACEAMVLNMKADRHDYRDCFKAATAAIAKAKGGA